MHTGPLGLKVYGVYNVNLDINKVWQSFITLHFIHIRAVIYYITFNHLVSQCKNAGVQSARSNSATGWRTRIFIGLKTHA